MFFCLPDMDEKIKNINDPNEFLNHENKYYIGSRNINFLLTNGGFEILEKQKYKDFVFYKTKKEINLEVSKIILYNYKSLISK